MANNSEASTERRHERTAMVTAQINARGVRDAEVLRAMREVPRHEFVDVQLRDHAYEDCALPLQHGQTISQPYIVAMMTEALQLTPSMKVLEIGTGCGYQSAVLAKLCKWVYSVEIVPQLASQTRDRLKNLGIRNVSVRTGDGYMGWPERAPFERIIVTAAPNHVPQPILDQLAEGGRLVIPVGEGSQELLILKRESGRLMQKKLIPVKFVPMTGAAQR